MTVSQQFAHELVINVLPSLCVVGIVGTAAMLVYVLIRVGLDK